MSTISNSNLPKTMDTLVSQSQPQSVAGQEQAKPTLDFAAAKPQSTPSYIVDLSSEASAPKVSFETSNTTADLAFINQRATAAAQKYIMQPGTTAVQSMNSFYLEWKQIEGKIESEKPGLANKDWDFVLKDGKFDITGDSLTDDEKNYLSSELNSNQTLLQSAQQFTDAAVVYTDTDDKTRNAIPGFIYSVTNWLKADERVYHNAKEQIEGNVTFRQFIEKNAEATKYTTNTKRYGYDFTASLSVLQNEYMTPYKVVAGGGKIG